MHSHSHHVPRRTWVTLAICLMLALSTLLTLQSISEQDAQRTEVQRGR